MNTYYRECMRLTVCIMKQIRIEPPVVRATPVHRRVLRNPDDAAPRLNEMAEGQRWRKLSFIEQLFIKVSEESRREEPNEHSRGQSEGRNPPGAATAERKEQHR